MFKVERDFLLYPAPAHQMDDIALEQYRRSNTYIRYNAFARALAVKRGSDEDRDIRTRAAMPLITVPDGSTRLHICINTALAECNVQEHRGNIYAAEASAIILDSYRAFYNPKTATEETE